MMDEYERAAAEFRSRIAGLTEGQYTRITRVRSPHVSKGSTVHEEPLLTYGLLTPATIMSHVVAAGYSYADYIRKAFSLEANSPQRRLLEHAESLKEFDSMLAYTVATLDGKWEMPEDEFTAVLMTVHWGPTYDLEQFLEHAIVHILRHRRQIDKWNL